MRILYLVNGYPRPSHTFIRREIEALEELGFSVWRVSIRPLTGPLPDAADRAETARTQVLLDRGVLGLIPSVFGILLRRPLRFLSAFGTAIRLAWRSEAGLLRHLGYFAEACRLALLAQRERVDWVHAHFGTNPPLVALLAERLGAPGFSFTVHGPEEFDRMHGLKLAEKIAAARFVAAISDFGRAQLERVAAPHDAAKLVVVPCGVDRSYLEDPGEAVAPGCRNLLFVGRLCAQKRPLDLVAAAERLAREGVDFRLRVVGDGELRAELAARVRAAGLEERVQLLGALDGESVRRELRACRALVLPSSAEGLPVVLMEAMALRRAVVTTAVAGIPELVRPGREGWLVPVGDLAALSEALKEALGASAEELERLGRAGAARVRERHDARASARLLAEQFRSDREVCTAAPSA